MSRDGVCGANRPLPVILAVFSELAATGAELGLAALLEKSDRLPSAPEC